MYPSAQALNYGQAVFEGMKAQRSVTSGRVVLFRPDCNAERMEAGAARMSMAAPPKDLFLEAVHKARTPAAGCRRRCRRRAQPGLRAQLALLGLT